MIGYRKWRTQNVWKGITSAMVCRAFVLAYRIVRKIVDEDGNNAWLCHGTPRRDFIDTYDDIEPRNVNVQTVAVKLDDTMGFNMDC